MGVQGVNSKRIEDVVGARDDANKLLEKAGKINRFKTFNLNEEVIIYTCKKGDDKTEIFSRGNTLEEAYSFFQGFNTACMLFKK